MKYTEKEIEIIKQRSYDKGKAEGSLLTLTIIGVAALLLFFYLSL